MTETYGGPAGRTGADRAPDLEAWPRALAQPADVVNDPGGPTAANEPLGGLATKLSSLVDEVTALRAEVAALRAVVEKLHQ